MSTTLRDKKRVFSELPIMQAMQSVRCGFELETQKVDGMDYDDFFEIEHEFDEEKYDSYIDDQVSSVFQSLEPETEVSRILMIEVINPIFNAALRFIATDSTWKTSYPIHLPSKLSLRWVYDYIPETALPSKESVLDALQEYFRDRVDSSDDCFNSERRVNNLPKIDGIVCDDDGSVSGIEFKIAGNGTTASRFSKLLKNLYRDYELDIDEICSFHIHISIPGIQHNYGPLMQCHLMEYLLSNLHRVPDRVQERWASDPKFFNPRISREKFSFVHFHENYGTWEFRCFGNVQNHREGMQCLKLAVEAMQFAYKVSLGMAKSLFKKPDDWEIGIFHNIITENESIESASKEVRTKQRNNQAA